MVVKKSAVARFEAKFAIAKNGCWVWQAGMTEGYGRFWFQGRLLNAHQFSYKLYVGEIPADKQLDHLCRNRACVNPDHLEAVTCQENLLRGNTFAAYNKAKTHCSKGHEFTTENTYNYKGERQCRECGREKCRRRARRGLVS